MPNQVWIILEGKVEVTTSQCGTSLKACTLPEGQVMGSLLVETRAATATCLDNCTFLYLNSERYNETVQDPERLSYFATKVFFRSVSLFCNLSDMEVERLMVLFRHITLGVNEILCKEGDKLDYLYLVKRGHCRVLKAFIPGGTVSEETDVALSHFEVVELEPKDFIGEGGLIPDEGRHARHSNFSTGASQKGTYPVSAVAVQGAEVYAAKIVDLKLLRSTAFQQTWDVLQHYCEARARAWHPERLGAQLHKQVLWDAYKRDVVLENVDRDSLARKIAVGEGGYSSQEEAVHNISS
ncbi:unnamed protein product [Choristocarpus tenellus]